VFLKGVAAAGGVMERVREEGELAVVKRRGGGGEEGGNLAAFGGLVAGEVVKGTVGAAEGVELVDDEIGEIVVVGGDVEEGAAIGGGGGAEDGGERKELEKVVTVMEEAPVKEDAGHGAVAVDERVVVGEPVVQEDGAQHGVQKGCGGAGVGESEEGFQAGGKFGGGRGLVEKAVFEVFETDGFVVAAEAAGGIGAGEGAGGEALVEFGEEGERERLGADFADEFEGAVVVEGHLLAAVARAATGAEQLAGDLGGEIGAFEVAGGDGLGHESTDGEVVAGVAIAEQVRQGGVGGEAAVEAVEGLGKAVGGAETEGMALAVFERDFAAAKLALEFEGEPPLTGGQVGRRGLEAEFVPVGVVRRMGKVAGIGDGDKARKIISFFGKKRIEFWLILF